MLFSPSRDAICGSLGSFFLQELCAELQYVETRRRAFASLISVELGFPRIVYRSHCRGSTKCPALPR